MAKVNFKKGLLSNLPSTYAEGTFYVTTDERGLYLDISDSTRVRIGDFQEFETLAALQANVNPSTTALYYIKELNVLAKWNGTQYVQINLDTGATAVEVVGSGNAVTSASYDAASRKITLTMGDTFATPSDVDTKIGTKVGAIDGTVKDYVDAATSGIASDERVGALEDRIDAAEADISALEGLVGDTAVGTQIDNKINALNLAGTYEVKGAADAVQGETEATVKDVEDSVTAIKDGTTIDSFGDVETALAGKQPTGDYATKTEAKGYADAKVASVTAGDASVTVGGTATAPTVAMRLSDDADNAMELVDDGVKVVIPAASEYSIAKDSNSGEYAAVYHLTKDGSNVGTAINIPKDMVVQSGSVVTDPEGQAPGTYIELVLQNVDEPLYIDVGSLIEYVTSGSGAGDMVVIAVSDDHKVTATITDGAITLTKLATDVQTAIGKAHTHTNADVLNGITATNIQDWNDAVAKEHEHANKDLLDTYTQTEANLADAVAKKHTHANQTVLDGVTDQKVVAWDAAEANAKAYADGLAVNYDAAGAAAGALTEAKTYADQAEADANAYTDTALTWGSF